MANNNSAIKRIRQANKKKLHNRYYIKSTRTAIKRLRTTTDKEKAAELLPQVSSMLDKLAKRNMIHKNKANNLKSKLAIHVNKLAWIGKKNDFLRGCPYFWDSLFFYFSITFSKKIL